MSLKSQHRFLIHFLWVAVMAIFLAEVEIQIEGDAGWASSLPTWRVEQHWLLDVFWGGRAMTGYHAWMFPFIAMVFHLPLFFLQRWTLRWQARCLASIMQFWIIEDFLWFILNPAFGWAGFNPTDAAWHKHWAMGAPIEYWLFSLIAFSLYGYSFRIFRKPTISTKTPI
ncbi:hypothetical protein RF679_12210 [Undibacterium cyanobacteriorum]|uniref:EXPERA domain-containing protein n=1 Tax=Undibacterium cyanobacteriorum TaxID=3073561 RepID=A0ABY9REQ2_9BURK|nr:hypothetical protein [Undibacterium sp. 20NA77.5]WMW79411.1 hypothetical protein RF679_12210 [Undibacterium sp. 20NA77.5]